eukprot:TRINITY_DN3302_c0_g1_i1.p2 TRINITY_DN3302_c0_g1~~TRINITY_DN3302_c0_g1_i1.p2  ORF type:complete len:240 (-),score=35.98 TRINITY_DN3302_c0_g1_i1:132-851(-)
MSIVLAVCLSVVICIAADADATAQIVLPPLHGRPPVSDDFRNVYVQVTGPDAMLRTIPVFSDGTFVARNLRPGMYNVDVVSERWTFPSFRIDVSRRKAGVYRVKYRDALGTDIKESPPQLLPFEPAFFFSQRPKVSVLPYLPLLMPIVLMFLMKRLMDMSDVSESMAELSEQQQAAGIDPDQGIFGLLKTAFTNPEALQPQQQAQVGSADAKAKPAQGAAQAQSQRTGGAPAAGARQRR